MPQILSASDLDSIKAAIREELAASEKSKTASLDIDVIEHLADVPGNFVYRLVLSAPVHFSPDQTITFRSRNPTDTVEAVIIRSDDDGLVVECQKPLPNDCKLLSLSFDPTFVLRALEDFIVNMAPKGGRIANLVVHKIIPESGRIRPRSFPGLNEEQALAVEEMATMPLHLLWGPPGTGKTTALGTAIAQWLRQNKRVLIVSTSNAAVDVALRAVLKNLRPDETRAVLRLGTSVDSVVREVTPAGKLGGEDGRQARAIAKAQERLRQIRELVETRNLSHDRRHELHAESLNCKMQVEEFNRKVALVTPQLKDGALVTGCTLAKMLLDKDLHQTPFDIVVLDEASMASMLYALAASFLATKHVVYAGDPKQLPPIVQAQGANAAKWLGQNVYDWFGVTGMEDMQVSPHRLLRTQYRMTNQIGGVVSRLSYGNALKHGRDQSGSKVVFIDIDAEWQSSHYSVAEKSYYHLAAIPLLHALSPNLQADDLLLLSPFRSQRSLLTALAADLWQSAAQRRPSASTIHRAQGSEAKSVIVDLTTHSPQQLADFFQDKHCARLFNVAISRARDRLLIIGSKSMLRELGCTIPFWGRVLNEFGQGVVERTCNQMLADLDPFDELSAVPVLGDKSLPAIYSHHPRFDPAWAGIDMLKNTSASRKLLVLTERVGSLGAGDCIVRTTKDCPSVFMAGGKVCLPYRGKWLAVQSPNVSRVVWRIAFSHLAGEEVDPEDIRYFCPKCSGGTLELRRCNGEGHFLVCTNRDLHTCNYRKRPSLQELKERVRLQSMRCPNGHPLTARQHCGRFFLGCENYPSCYHTQSLANLEGM